MSDFANRRYRAITGVPLIATLVRKCSAGKCGITLPSGELGNDLGRAEGIQFGEWVEQFHPPKHPRGPLLLGGNRNSPAVQEASCYTYTRCVPTASALEIGNHIAGYTDYYAIRV